jgi:hypothetical protein
LTGHLIVLDSKSMRTFGEQIHFISAAHAGVCSCGNAALLFADLGAWMVDCIRRFKVLPGECGFGGWGLVGGSALLHTPVR